MSTNLQLSIRVSQQTFLAAEASACFVHTNSLLWLAAKTIILEMQDTRLPH